jgi:hypothetical protein
MNYKTGKSHIVKDERGILMANDFDTLPFIPKRVIFIRFSEDSRPRGDHSYKHEQIIQCLRGNIKVYLKTGKETDCVELKQGDWVWIEPRLWVIMSGQCDCSMAAIYSSEKYKTTDFETNWNKYLNEEK